MIAPPEFTPAPITASVIAAATIPAFAAPDPTPDKPIAVAMPTDESGDTIKKAKSIPNKTPINNGDTRVAWATT